MKNFLKRWLLLIILVLLMIVAYFSGLTDYIQFENLKNHREQLLNYVENHFVLSSILYILFYICIVALSIPGASFVTIFGGFLFAQPLSTIYVILGASSGACIIFLAAKTSLGEFFRSKAGAFLKKMEKGFQNNKISYLLFLRLVPIFPFWLVNIAPAFFRVRLWTFYWTTFLGIIPGTFVYTQAGAGLGAILDSGEKFTLQGIFNWQIRVALIALGLFALLPILYKKLRKKRNF